MFDARSAKLLTPGQHLTIDGCPGLRLVATAQYRTWKYRYKSPADQLMKQIKLGRWPEMSLAGAMGAWESLSKARSAGQDPAADKRTSAAAAKIAFKVARTGAYTVGQVADDYLAGHVFVNRAEKGAKEVQRMFKQMLGDDRDRTASEYGRADAFALLERWVQSPVQAKKLKAELGAAWDWALDAGKLPDTTPNWWRQILRGKIKSKGKRIEGRSIGTGKRALTDREVALLIPWLPNFPERIADALTLYLWTGTRGVEIVSMEAHEVAEEADGWWWTIPKWKTKNARHENAGDLRVPLIGRAVEVVCRRKAAHPKGFLFASGGRLGHMEQRDIQTKVFIHQPYCVTRPEYARPRLLVTHWAPHDLRRTVRTVLAVLGCPEPVAESVLGHMQAGIKGIYNVHKYDQERRAWLALLDAHWERLCGQVS